MRELGVREAWRIFWRWVAAPTEQPWDADDPFTRHAAVRVGIRVMFGTLIVLAACLGIGIVIVFLVGLVELLGVWAIVLPVVLSVGAAVGRLVIR